MPKVYTQILKSDVIVYVKTICKWVEYAMLSSRRNRLEWKASCLVSELLELLSEIQAAEVELSTELKRAAQNEGKNFGKSPIMRVSKEELLKWVGDSQQDRLFDRPDQSWKSHIHHKTLSRYNLNPQRAPQGGALQGRAASLLDKAGPSGTTVYTHDSLAKHAVKLAAGMGADQVMGFKPERGGGNSGGDQSSEKAIKKELRKETPFDSSGCENHKEYEQMIHKQYMDQKGN